MSVLKCSFLDDQYRGMRYNILLRYFGAKGYKVEDDDDMAMLVHIASNEGFRFGDPDIEENFWSRLRREGYWGPIPTVINIDPHD